MSRVYSDTVLPEDSGVSQDLTLGTTGDSVVVTAGASLNVNTVKDAGGNTLFTSDGSGTLSSMNAAFSGKPTLLDTNTFTGASSSAFTSLISSTYKLYFFRFYAVNPATVDAFFTFQCSTDGGSNYNLSQTTTVFRAYHYENDTGSGLTYDNTNDQSIGTAYQTIVKYAGGLADESAAGELFLFNPSSAWTKNWYCTGISMESGGGGGAYETFTSGAFTTTTAINAIDFKMSSGNMDGIIKMYGL